MIINKIFQVTEALRTLNVLGTPYTLEESGLIYEISVVGDDLNIAKVSFICSERGDSPEWAAFIETVKERLLSIEGILLTEIRFRYYTNLSIYCPQEIQNRY